MIRKIYEWWLDRKKDKIIYIANLLLRELIACGYIASDKTGLAMIFLHDDKKMSVECGGHRVEGIYEK